MLGAISALISAVYVCDACVNTVISSSSATMVSFDSCFVGKRIANLLFYFAVCLCPLNAKGQVFGPRNFLECTNEMVKAPNNKEYGVASAICRKRFPKLINISQGRDSSLACEDDNQKSVYRIQIRSGKVSILERSSVDFETVLRTKEGITFRGKAVADQGSRNIRIFGKIDSESGDGRLIVEYEDKRSPDFVYSFNCVETR
jgi:hypothetical protein